MNWFVKFLTSNIGRKLVMSLTGLFLITFLVIHLIGNIQIILDPSGGNFTAFTHFMETNPLIKVMAYVLYAGFLIHIIQGFILYFVNRKSKGPKYAVSNNVETSIASKNMTLLGTLLLVFLIVHMGDFFVPLKVTHEITEQQLFQRIIDLYHNIGYVIFYVIGMIVLGFHLSHGFQSAFQTLGINHKKYTPFIKSLGLAYSIIIPLGFALIPLIVYFA